MVLCLHVIRLLWYRHMHTYMHTPSSHPPLTQPHLYSFFVGLFCYCHLYLTIDWREGSGVFTRLHVSIMHYHALHHIPSHSVSAPMSTHYWVYSLQCTYICMYYNISKLVVTVNILMKDTTQRNRLENENLPSVGLGG